MSVLHRKFSILYNELELIYCFKFFHMSKLYLQQFIKKNEEF